MRKFLLMLLPALLLACPREDVKHAFVPSGDDTGTTGSTDDTGSGTGDTGAETGDTGDSAPPVDADGDGYPASDDCDDANPAVSPGATELCNGIDDDCDGQIDEDGAADARTWYTDADGDTYGDPATGVAACDAPVGSAPYGTDCDDSDAAIHPGATEVAYDGLDNDCDASTLDDDLDGDGYGIAEDCDDTSSAVHPGATEVCENAVDDDCNGEVDDTCSTTTRDTLLIVPASTSTADMEAAAVACGVSGIASGIPPRDEGLGFTDADLPVFYYEDVTDYEDCRPETVGGSTVEVCDDVESVSRSWEPADCAGL